MARALAQERAGKASVRTPVGRAHQIGVSWKLPGRCSTRARAAAFVKSKPASTLPTCRPRARRVDNCRATVSQLTWHGANPRTQPRLRGPAELATLALEHWCALGSTGTPAMQSMAEAAAHPQADAGLIAYIGNVLRAAQGGHAGERRHVLQVRKASAIVVRDGSQHHPAAHTDMRSGAASNLKSVKAVMSPMVPPVSSSQLSAAAAAGQLQAAVTLERHELHKRTNQTSMHKPRHTRTKERQHACGRC